MTTAILIFIRGDTMAVKCDFCGKNGAHSLMDNGAWVCNRCINKLGGLGAWDDRIKTMGRAKAYEIIFGRSHIQGTSGNARKRIYMFKIITILITIAIGIALYYLATAPKSVDGAVDAGTSIAAVVVVFGVFALIVIGIITLVKSIKDAKVHRVQKKRIEIQQQEDALKRRQEELARQQAEYVKQREEYSRLKMEFEQQRQREYNRQLNEEYERKRRAEEEERQHWKITDEMTGVEFEQYCAMELKRDYGFVRVEFTKTSGDYGGDLVAYHKDGSKWVIQCKRYRSRVGLDAVQEVLGAKAIYDADRMAVMTNNMLTASAKELARKSDVLVRENIKGSMRFD